jgi:hypothetical protein
MTGQHGRAEFSTARFRASSELKITKGERGTSSPSVNASGWVLGQPAEGLDHSPMATNQPHGSDELS